MTATFSFGFAGNDIDNDNATELDGAPKADQSAAPSTTSLPAKRHSLEDLLSTLPSYLSYNYLDIPILSNDVARNQSSQPGPNTSATDTRAFTVPRRSLHDIRVQLMAESTLGEDGNDDLIAGLDTGDLSSGFYEGGFKTWECAIDLAAFVANNVTLTEDQDWHVIELGAGSGIPSLTILRRALSRTRTGTERIKFTFCDYNEEVLKLVTVPNVLLLWWEFCVKRNSVSVQEESSGEADLDDINEYMAHRFMTDCNRKGVSFDFISGAWGSSFVDLIGSSLVLEVAVPISQRRVIILASETIYSPASLTSFVNTVMDLLRVMKNAGTAYIAAKRIYFGVGGGIPEFELEMRKVGGSVKEVINITESGVGRVILEVSLT